MDTEMLMIIAGLMWFFSSFVAAHVAGEKRRSEWTWLFLSLLFSPIITLLALAALPTGNKPPINFWGDPKAGDLQ